MSTIATLFVDREKQTAGFIKMLDRGTDKRIMLIDAAGGLGKSWTIEYMRGECQRRGVPNVEIDFADGIVYDFLTLLRRARDSLGAAAFNDFTQAINAVTQPVVRIEGAGGGGASIDLGTGNSVSDVAINEVAGGSIIKDNSFVINADSPVVRQALQDRLTVAFFDCLERLAATQQICFFFDTYDKVTVEAESWLLAQLLPRVRDGRLTNVIIVITGRSVPKLDSVWDSVVARTGLDMLKLEHVSEYLLERCKLANIDERVIETLFRASTGQPQLLALMAENIRRSQTQESDDDWL